MKKLIIVALTVICSISVFAQERDYNTQKGLSFGIGLPIEMRDLPGMGATLNIGYDCAYPVNDRFALGFYLTGGGGFWGELLAGETACLEPAIRVGYNFGRKVKARN